MRSILSRYRVGSVPYLNALPLTAGVEDVVLQQSPAELARGLSAGQLDVALASSTEVLFSHSLRALAGVGILSRGPVYSVFLAHRQPLPELRQVHVDSSSCTSVNLLRVLLALRGIRPEFVPLPVEADASQFDNLLLIGNPAIHFRRQATNHTIWDLGAAWNHLTDLPFTYALWAFRDDFDPQPLAAALREVAEAGIEQIPDLIVKRSEFDLPFRQAYVGGHIQYRLDEDARIGLDRFGELLADHTGQKVHPIRWIEP